MIYRFTSNLALSLAKQANHSESTIGLTFNNKPFVLPADNDVETWLHFPQDIVPIEQNVWESEEAMIIDRTDNDLKQSQSKPIFQSETNGVYLYKNNEDKYYEVVGKASKTEADAYVDECWQIAYPKNILVAKSNKIKEIKNTASKLLSISDYKVIRHRDQLDANLATTITDTEYQTLLTERNNIRQKSNQFESEVMELTELEAIQNYTYSY